MVPKLGPAAHYTDYYTEWARSCPRFPLAFAVLYAGKPVLSGTFRAQRVVTGASGERPTRSRQELSTTCRTQEVLLVTDWSGGLTEAAFSMQAMSEPVANDPGSVSKSRNIAAHFLETRHSMNLTDLAPSILPLANSDRAPGLSGPDAPANRAPWRRGITLR